jgi:hypothetical protein
VFSLRSEWRAWFLARIGIVGLLTTLGCEGEKPDRVGICEQLSTSFDVITADRSASIAAVDTESPCTLSPSSCTVHMNADASATTACEQVTVRARSAGSCTLTITSVWGEKVRARVDIRLEITDGKCRDDIGRIVANVPILVPDRPAVVVHFARPGADAI